MASIGPAAMTRPSTSTAMRSQTACRLSRSWVTMNTVRSKRALQGADQLVEVGGADRIEAGGRLVEEDDVGVERERTRQRHALDHAAGKLGRELCRRTVRDRRPTISSLASAISSISRGDRSRYSRIGNCTFWRTVSEENSAPCWNSTPQRRSIGAAFAAVEAGEIAPEHLDGACALRQRAR